MSLSGNKDQVEKEACLTKPICLRTSKGLGVGVFDRAKFRPIFYIVIYVNLHIFCLILWFWSYFAENGNPWRANNGDDIIKTKREKVEDGGDNEAQAPTSFKEE